MNLYLLFFERFHGQAAQFADPHSGSGDRLQETPKPLFPLSPRRLQQPAVFFPRQIFFCIPENLPLLAAGLHAKFVSPEPLKKMVERSQHGIGACDFILRQEFFFVSQNLRSLQLPSSHISDEGSYVPQILFDRVFTHLSFNQIFFICIYSKTTSTQTVKLRPNWYLGIKKMPPYATFF